MGDLQSPFSQQFLPVAADHFAIQVVRHLYSSFKAELSNPYTRLLKDGSKPLLTFPQHTLAALPLPQGESLPARQKQSHGKCRRAPRDPSGAATGFHQFEVGPVVFQTMERILGHRNSQTPIAMHIADLVAQTGGRSGGGEGGSNTILQYQIRKSIHAQRCRATFHRVLTQRDTRHTLLQQPRWYRARTDRLQDVAGVRKLDHLGLAKLFARQVNVKRHLENSDRAGKALIWNWLVGVGHQNEIADQPWPAEIEPFPPVGPIDH